MRDKPPRSPDPGPQYANCARRRRVMKLQLAILVCVCVIVMAESYISWRIFNTAERLSAANNRLIVSLHELSEAEQARSFAHGFIYGQRSSIRNARLPVPLPPVRESSREDRANASRHGFTTADDDPAR